MKDLPIQYGDLYYKVVASDGKEILVPCKELDNTQKYIFNFLETLHEEKEENNDLKNENSYIFEYNFLEINNLCSVKFLKRVLNKIFIKTKFPPTVDKNGFYKLVTLEGRLPENAITTPLIINIIIDIFEKEILEFCLNNEIIFDRTNSKLFFFSEKDNSKMIKDFLKNLLS